MKSFCLILLLALTGNPCLAAKEPFRMPANGYLLLEAENLPYSDLWQFIEIDSNRVMGSGYLKYVGPVTGSGHGQEIDEEGKLQGDPADWLVIPVEISEPGRYRINLRNHHLKKDGDNDIWVHVIGYPLPIRRVGDHAVDTYQWLTWGPEWVYFDLEVPGTYEFYVAGRSHGFAVDRIAIYNETAPITMYHRSQVSVNQAK